MAAEMGYSKVWVYREGLLGWAKSGLTLEQNIQYPDTPIPLISAKTITDTGHEHYQVIDIRPTSHFIKGHIQGSDHIDLEELHLNIDKLSQDKSIVLVDHKGKLTLTTGRFLAYKGIANVLRLDGGFNAWVKEGYAVVRTEERP
jgi:rhodanese-related sulfurtransferase